MLDQVEADIVASNLLRLYEAFVLWVEGEIQDWIAARITERDADTGF